MKTTNNKMNITKIINISRTRTGEKGCYNRKWLVRCNHCGKIFEVQYSNMYKPCKYCGSENTIIDTREEVTKKEDLFRTSRRLFNEFKKNNILTPKEMELLVHLRETKFKSVLYDLISDYWLQPQPKSKYTLKEEQLINKRGRSLLLNDNFIRLLEECYDFILPRK
jgi:DNA-directed RNA polymerase subunit RPC12/RpoP